MRYPDDQGILRRLLQLATTSGFSIDEISTESHGHHVDNAVGGRSDGESHVVQVTMHVHGKASVNELAAAFSEVSEVEAVVASDVNAIDE